MRLFILTCTLAVGLLTARDAQAARRSPLEHNWATVGGTLGHPYASWPAFAGAPYASWGVGPAIPATSPSVSVAVVVPVTVVCPTAAPAGSSAGGGRDIYRVTPKEIVLDAGQGHRHPVD